MKFRQLGKWDNPGISAKLIYFAQLVDELTFTFTHSTYKPSVTHCGILCGEAISTIEDVEKGVIKPPNIDHVIAKLCKNLEKDLTAKNLSPLPISMITEKLKNPKNPKQEKKTIIEILTTHLSPLKYKQENERLISEEIKNESQGKNRIRSLTRTYMTTLLAIGYHSKYIEKKSQDFFHYNKDRISGPEAIDAFLSLFNTPKETYSATFRASRIFLEIADTCKALDVKIEKETTNEILLKRLPKNDLEVYATIEKIDGLDRYSVRSYAEQRIKNISTLLTLFHHKEHPAWSKECLLSKEDGQTYLLASQISPMQKCADSRPEVASKKLSSFMDNFSLEKTSFLKFIRSAQLHSMALESNAEENQLLNLWISLESLIPTEEKSDDSSAIEHITKSVIPFLSIRYIEGLLNNLVKDLLKWNSKVTKAALKNVDGLKFTERLLRVITQQKYSSNLLSIESELRDFHLLKDRIDYFKEKLATPQAALEIIKDYEERVTWQIRRIYRARNIIVHSGKTPPYTKHLIEHAHEYLDIILDNLVELGSNPKIAKSTSQGFKYMGMYYDFYSRNLEKKGLVFDDSNITRLLFFRHH